MQYCYILDMIQKSPSINQ